MGQSTWELQRNQTTCTRSSSLLPSWPPLSLLDPPHTEPLLHMPQRSSPPQPYAYEYGVNDDYSKANFKKTETQDANGVVQGSFVIALPDGRIQTTKYTADHVLGFVAEVSYEGTPVYPPEPAGGYGHPAPAYKPARR